MKKRLSDLTKSVPLLMLINNRKHTGTAKKAAPVELRVTYRGKQKYIATGIKVLPSEWDKANGVVKRRADAAQLNEVLSNIKNEVLEVVMELYKSDKLDLSTLSDYLLHDGKNESFLAFVERVIQERSCDVSDGTAQRWRSWLHEMKRWGGIMSFDDVSKENVDALDKYLHERKLKQGTISNYHKSLKYFITEAIRKDFLTENPYQKYDIEISRGEPCTDRYLTDKEVEDLAKAKMPTESLDKVRDVFLFQCLTGLSYKDVSEFNPDFIEKGDGVEIYTNRRIKTNMPFVFVLLPRAQRILEKYSFSLPVVSNSQYNLRLKVVAQAAGIDKPISTHWGRHTAAMVWLNHGIPLEVVSRCLGHSSTAITQKVYAHLENASIRKAFENLKQSEWMK